MRGHPAKFSGNLATDDALWLLMAMLRGYNDRRFGRYLGRRLTRILVAPAPWDGECDGRALSKADNSLLDEVTG